jgi:hypothetical protein
VDVAPAVDPTPPTAPAQPTQTPPPATVDAPLSPSVVGAALATLGIAPAPGSATSIIPVHVCATGIATIGSVSAGSSYLAPSAATPRTRRELDDPPTVRGPPAPVDSPFSPVVAGSAAATATAGSSGAVGAALVLAGDTVELPELETVTPAPIAAPPAPAIADDGARAPPAS